MMRTLLVSRDPALRSPVEAALSRSGSGTPGEFEILSGIDPEHPPGPFDLAIVEHAPPETDCLAALRRLRGGSGSEQAQIIAVVPGHDLHLRAAALAEGADDVVASPFDPQELELRVAGALQRLTAARAHARAANWIDQQLDKVKAELEARQEEVISRLSRAAEYRDQDTGEHIVRMAGYCALIAEELGFSAETSRFLYIAAQMHDVGKIGIPDSILQKPGRFTPEERTIMETHTLIGQKILGGSDSPLMKAAEMIALTHHERWDGTGYPNGLKGEEIPIAGRIAAVADVFDALTSERPYKKGWSLEDARDELIRCRGSHFDPRCVDAFLRRWGDVQEIASLRVNDVSEVLRKPAA